MSKVVIANPSNGEITIKVKGEDRAKVVELAEVLRAYLFMSFDPYDDSKLTWEWVDRFCQMIIVANNQI
jgi:hypothetical protein